jgi:hypothetical protein
MKLYIINSDSSGNSYILQSDTDSLILECGMPLIKIKQALNFNMVSVCGCLVTHRHL